MKQLIKLLLRCNYVVITSIGICNETYIFGNLRFLHIYIYLKDSILGILVRIITNKVILNSSEPQLFY